MDQGKTQTLKNKKENISRKKTELKSTNTDWRPVYSDLISEIKLRHYSPSTIAQFRSNICGETT